MNGTGRQLLAVVAALAVGGFAAGCKNDDGDGANHEIWFMGSIYDGATSMVLFDYDISLVYGTTTVKGKVDRDTGRYTLGPLPAWNDYGVVISQGGYRAFTSYNSMIAPPTPPPASQQSDVYTAHTTQTLDFDAYLFPDTLQASALTVNITKADPNAAAAAGSIRLRPSTLPVIQDQAAGVTGQVWSNDQDILSGVVNSDFSGGTITIDPGTLVYGVTYQVTVYNVEGYQPGTTTVRAGLQDSVIVNLTTSASPLVLVSSTATACKPYGTSTTVQATAQVTFTFNTSMIEDVTTSAGKGPEVLDNGLTLSTLMGATLKTSASTAVQERGSQFLLNGNTLTIQFNPAAGITTQYANDTITYVLYNNLSSIMLQPTGHPELVKSLSTLTGMSSIQCYM
jgi:hypothetical protein